MSVISLHLLSTAFMTGLIWTVQLLVYPGFTYVKEDRAKAFHQRHSRMITFIVAPLMLIELATALYLLLQSPQSPLWQLNFLFLILIWLSTALLSVPIHQRLSHSWSLTEINKLVRTNWPRTALWSLRLVLLALFST